MNTLSRTPCADVRLGLLGLSVLALSLALAPRIGNTQAAGTVELLATPPEITTTVAPNLMISFDDSGSMGRNYMPDQRPITGAGWGATDSQNFLGSASYPSGGAPFLCAGQIDPRVTNPSDPRTETMNGVYYNPNANYTPPLRADGVTPFPAASFSGAYDNGIIRHWPTVNGGTSTARNLTTATLFCGQKAGYWRYKSTAPTLTTDVNGRITNTGTLYTASNWEYVALPAAEQQNFANWYQYYHTRSMAARSAFSRAVANFDEGIRVSWQNFNSNQIVATTTIGKFANAAIPLNLRTNFYNWLFTHPVSGNTPNQPTTNRAGQFYQRPCAGDAACPLAPTAAARAVDTNPYWDRDLSRELSCRQNFHLNITDGLWNNSTVTTATNDTIGSQVLPDGRTYSTSAAASKIMWNEAGPNARSMADVAWHYWRTNLRPDFGLRVPPFIPDRTTNLFGTPLTPGADPRDNAEVYWNPANDPATWPHMVNFFIGLGVDGTIPRNDTSYLRLRQGLIQWPATVLGTDDERKMDDIWHAAINSRGKYFTTSNPEQLVNALDEIIASIISRRGASTAVSVSLPIITDGTTGYTAGYDSSDWSGFVTRNSLDLTTAERTGILWDAGCKLTGGACASTAQTGLPVRDPNTRVIVTSLGTPGSGRPFRWSDLHSTQQARLNVNPTTINLLTNSGTADGYGINRVEYVRGSRVNESTPNPRLRTRSSVLGAVIRGQPVYVSSPAAGLIDDYPPGSPEEVARAAGNSYAQYVNDQRERSPTIYVAANDGMLHAFNASTGVERWAYVPNVVINNWRLTKSTQFESGLTPTADDKPLVTDVYLNGAWRTVLLGSLRLGGRGLYALDITNVEDTPSESGVATKVMWEFSNVPPPGYVGSDCAVGSRYCSRLGYTYESINIARLKYQNKWVALVSSGYFPKDLADPAATSTAAATTSLFVIDLATGTLIKEIPTSTASQTASATFGLSTAIVYDLALDQVDDVAIAGDLAGNLWRFDLSSDNTSAWKVDLMFRSYGNGGAANPGDQPISAAPITMKDLTNQLPMVIFGTGKFLGNIDRTAAIPEQSFYGIRDYGTCNGTNPTACANYPIQVGQLVTQTMTQDGNGVRRITSNNPIPLANRGWRIRMNIPTETGERSTGIPFPFYTANQVVLRSLVPKTVDPCDPGARYGLIVVDAETGTARVNPADATPSRIVGGIVSGSTPPGDPITLRGGGAVVIAGLTERDGIGNVINQAAVDAITGALSNADDIWHRGAWRELLEQM